MFTIEILEQGWLEETAAVSDPCSHGYILLTIGGQQITSTSEQYGVSVSALALLRTLAKDHNPHNRIADHLILHGCGCLLMMGCPIGVDFSVKHVGDAVMISDIARYDTTSDSPTIKFVGLSATIPRSEYQQAILDFAEKAREPFRDVVKTFEDEFDAEQYREFWKEYNALCGRFSTDS